MKRNWGSDMEDKLIKLLEAYGYPVRRQGSLAEDEEYPDAFFTFWNSTNEIHGSYDNKPFGTNYFFDVNFYSRNPGLCYQIMEQVEANLRQQGFIISGKAYDVASDEPTHIGKGLEVRAIKI